MLDLCVLVETGSLYSGLFSTGGSAEFTVTINSEKTESV